jgi:hypothetical protein
MNRQFMWESALNDTCVFLEDGLLEKEAIQAELQGHRTERHAGDGGDPVMPGVITTRWCLPRGWPRPSNCGNQLEPRLVSEDEMGGQLCGVSSIRGHWWHFQALMACSSCSSSPRSGFWLGQFRFPIGRPMWCQWYRTPNWVSTALTPYWVVCKSAWYPSAGELLRSPLPSPFFGWASSVEGLSDSGLGVRAFVSQSAMTSRHRMTLLAWQSANRVIWFRQESCCRNVTACRRRPFKGWADLCGHTRRIASPGCSLVPILHEIAGDRKDAIRKEV